VECFGLRGWCSYWRTSLDLGKEVLALVEGLTTKPHSENDGGMDATVFLLASLQTFRYAFALSLLASRQAFS
jgi:hypothetical protein